MATADALVAPKTCRRCSGEGRLGFSYANGVCAACGGAGVVEGDVATIAHAKAVRDFLVWAVEEGARRDRGARATWAAAAVRHLAKVDEARYAKALASWEAGHTGLYEALIAYAVEAAR